MTESRLWKLRPAQRDVDSVCYSHNAMRARLRFWLVYSIAWLPLAAGYVRLFVGHLNQTFAEGIRAAIFGVFPAAILGIGVVIICERLPWSIASRVRFLSIHLASSVLYFALWMATAQVLYALDQRIEYGSTRSSLEVLEVGFVTGLLVYVTIAGIVYAIQATERLHAEEARVRQLENLRTRAELEALRAQLNPHFLFNTLHSLMALVRHDPKAAEDALERLATLLRHTLMTTENTDDVALHDELDFIQNYLALERLRLGERLRIEEKIQPETLPYMLPPFTLQPLIENSIKHAIGRRVHGGLLTIRTRRHNGLLQLEVSDDGPGANPDEVAVSGGSGLRIARQRLMTRYKNRATFEVNTGLGKGFCVRIEIPTSEFA